jgi:hypothetical protein
LRFSSKSMCARKAVFVKKIANIFTIFCENIFLMITLTPGRIYLRTFLTEKKILGWIEGLVVNLNSKLCSRIRKGFTCAYIAWHITISINTDLLT